MEAFRLFLRDRRHFAAVLVALALAMKALMPAGYMVAPDGAKVLTITICADSQGGSYTKQIIVPHSGKHAAPTEQAKDACPYSALSMATLGGADPVLLALALAFILALGFAAAPPLRLGRTPRLRPPLRGPPATAR